MKIWRDSDYLFEQGPMDMPPGDMGQPPENNVPQDNSTGNATPNNDENFLPIPTHGNVWDVLQAVLKGKKYKQKQTARIPMSGQGEGGGEGVGGMPLGGGGLDLGMGGPPGPPMGGGLEGLGGGEPIGGGEMGGPPPTPAPPPEVGPLSGGS